MVVAGVVLRERHDEVAPRSLTLRFQDLPVVLIVENNAEFKKRCWL
jgi:hypothetical protein